MSNNTQYDLRKRLNDLHQKLNDTNDPIQKKKIGYDIRIIKLRLEIEQVKNLKKSTKQVFTLQNIRISLKVLSITNKGGRENTLDNSRIKKYNYEN